jgi:hypothetical protein
MNNREIKHELGYVETYVRPSYRRDPEEAFNFSVVSACETRFIYNVKTKRIYEIIGDQYKHVCHEDITGHFNLDIDDSYKFCIDMEYGRYKSALHYMGIRWLTLSEIYQPLPHKLEVLEPLTHQDLDRIEKYVDIEVKKFLIRTIELDRIYALEDDIKRLL